jgi:hypothetical protein
MAKKKKGKQTKGGSSLRKAVKGKSGFLRKGKEKPKGPPGEIKPKPPKNPEDK